MSVSVCCVCQRPLEEGARSIGRRLYCDEHHAKVTRERDHLWQSGWVLVAALVGKACVAGSVKNNSIEFTGDETHDILTRAL